MEGAIYQKWLDAGYFTADPTSAKPGVFDRAAAAERDRQPAHGSRAGTHHDGRADPPQADAGLRGAVAAGHGPRRHRHPERGGKAARGRRQDQRGLRPRAVRRQGLGLEARVRRRHRRPDAPARRRGGLEPRPVHHGRGTVAGGAHDLQAALRRRADLSGRAAGQLVTGARDGDLGPRGQLRGRRRRVGVVPVRLARRRAAPHRGRHHPGRDDAGRHRDRGASRRRPLPAPGRHRRCRTRSWTASSSSSPTTHVDPEFGTGAVKVTPAHDPNDFEIGLRHQLPMPSIMDTKGRIADTGTQFDGMDRFEARVAVREALAAQGRIVEEKRPVPAQRRALRAQRRADRTAAVAAVVGQGGIAGQGRRRRGAQRRTP